MKIPGRFFSFLPNKHGLPSNLYGKVDWFFMSPVNSGKCSSNRKLATLFRMVYKQQGWPISSSVLYFLGQLSDLLFLQFLWMTTSFWRDVRYSRAFRLHLLAILFNSLIIELVRSIFQPPLPLNTFLFTSQLAHLTDLYFSFIKRSKKDARRNWIIKKEFH